MSFEFEPGSTPLDPEEADGLKPSHIMDMAALNEWEYANILDAEGWAFAHRHSTVLNDAFVRELHRRMFDRCWHWAGKYRRSDKNIGAHWPTIAEGVREMCTNAVTWIEQAAFPRTEAAVRLHLRCVQIHPFVNGNGRHARLLADVWLHGLGEPRLTWGRAELLKRGDVREAYLAALRQADHGDIAALLHFATS